MKLNLGLWMQMFLLAVLVFLRGTSAHAQPATTPPITTTIVMERISEDTPDRHFGDYFLQANHALMTTDGLRLLATGRVVPTLRVLENPVAHGLISPDRADEVVTPASLLCSNRANRVFQLRCRSDATHRTGWVVHLNDRACNGAPTLGSLLPEGCRHPYVVTIEGSPVDVPVVTPVPTPAPAAPRSEEAQPLAPVEPAATTAPDTSSRESATLEARLTALMNERADERTEHRRELEGKQSVLTQMGALLIVSMLAVIVMSALYLRSRRTLRTLGQENRDLAETAARLAGANEERAHWIDPKQIAQEVAVAMGRIAGSMGKIVKHVESTSRPNIMAEIQDDAPSALMREVLDNQSRLLRELEEVRMEVKRLRSTDTQRTELESAIAERDTEIRRLNDLIEQLEGASREIGEQRGQEIARLERELTDAIRSRETALRDLTNARGEAIMMTQVIEAYRAQEQSRVQTDRYPSQLRMYLGTLITLLRQNGIEVPRFPTDSDLPPGSRSAPPAPMTVRTPPPDAALLRAATPTPAQGISPEPIVIPGAPLVPTEFRALDQNEGVPNPHPDALPPAADADRTAKMGTAPEPTPFTGHPAAVPQGAFGGGDGRSGPTTLTGSGPDAVIPPEITKLFGAGSMSHGPQVLTRADGSGVTSIRGESGVEQLPTDLLMDDPPDIAPPEPPPSPLAAHFGDAMEPTADMLKPADLDPPLVIHPSSVIGAVPPRSNPSWERRTHPGTPPPPPGSLRQSDGGTPPDPEPQ